jgi:simple sugar transport system permease protein
VGRLLTYNGYRLQWSSTWVHLPIALAVGAAFGALLWGFAGFLKATWGSGEVISIIMLNSIMAGVVDYLTQNQFRLKNQPNSPPDILHLLGSHIAFGYPSGFLIAIISGSLYRGFKEKKTTTGFEFESVGKK